jgi:hypothetical protein
MGEASSGRAVNGRYGVAVAVESGVVEGFEVLGQLEGGIDLVSCMMISFSIS